MSKVDPEFTGSRIMSGFGSGEAMVAELASNDPKPKTHSNDSDESDETANEGDAILLPDKRILVIEPEFARVLAAGSWSGSTMSSIIRQGWDGDSLQLRVRRQKPLVADEPHMVVVGHITLEELKSRLTNTDMFSGYVNRFLLFCVTRSKVLPSGGNVDQVALDRVARKINRTLNRVRDFDLMTRTPRAEELWKDLYHEMAEDDPGGLLGAAVARAEPQVLRISVAYALAAGSSTIMVQHVEAAWALWSYARSSAEYIFGDGSGSGVADTILAAARAAGRSGVSRTEISEVLGRHRSSKELDAIEALLLRQGRIEVVPPRKSKGRPEHRIRVTELQA
jgi:hypothetical protein